MSIPRLKWPLEVVDGQYATVEQDTGDDIFQCVLGVARTRQGERPDKLDMCLPDLAFGEQPVDVDELVAAVEQYEPRAALLAESEIDRLDATIADVRLRVDVDEET